MMSEMSSSEKPEFCLPTRRGSSTSWVAEAEPNHQSAKRFPRLHDDVASDGGAADAATGRQH